MIVSSPKQLKDWANFFTIKVNMMLDITTGDMIIPREIEYSFKLISKTEAYPLWI